MFKRDKMDRIKKLYKTELKYLKDAVKDGKSLYHTFTLSSLRGSSSDVSVLDV